MGFPAGEYIDRDDVLAVTELWVDSNAVGSLEGLQYLTNLESLTAQPGDWTAAAGELAGGDPLAPLKCTQSWSMENRCSFGPKCPIRFQKPANF